MVSRHNKIRDILVETCRRAHIGVQVEVGNNLTHDHNKTRPADILLSNWFLGKPAALDVSITSPLNPLTLWKREFWPSLLLRSQRRGNIKLMIPNVRNLDGYVSPWWQNRMELGAMRPLLSFHQSPPDSPPLHASPSQLC